MVKVVNKIKEKFVGVAGSISGGLSFLGSYQVCHNACLALVAFLTFLGFAVAGMPLLFLTKVAIPFWTVAVSLLTITIILKYKKRMHLSGKLILFNSGLIIAGVPFQQVQNFNYLSWIVGGILAIFSIGWHIYDKIEKK
ncbi:hypothetical protein HYW20_04380 [Candidatus Woesearchaeota archaeon]|nr:hypothetical protein [Candidatus Woesearchaeota archaeon]